MKTKLVNSTALRRSICQESFFDFVKVFWGEVIAETPIWNWHIKYLCDLFQEDAERVFAGLPKKHDTIINISPGTTKSTIMSVMAPAWIHARMPSARVLTASHTQTLTFELGRKSRLVERSEKYRQAFPEVIPASDQDTKQLSMNTAGGGRMTCTVGGSSPMGFHAHFIIVDDPLDPQQAGSTTELDIEAANNFMSEVVPSRKVDKEITPTYLIMQRLNQNDPSGFLLSKQKETTRHICLPAYKSPYIKPVSLRKRYVDGLMDPIRLSQTVLDEAKIDLGEFGFAGQYGQHPVPRGGGMFKTHLMGIGITPPALSHRGWVVLCRGWDKAGCLSHDTRVVTGTGPRYIKDVRAGDHVVTRCGLKKVLWSGISGYVDSLTTAVFDDGSSLTGTYDHPVWDQGSNQWVPLERLVEKYDGSTVGGMFESRVEGTFTATSGLRKPKVTAIDPCTGISGKHRTAKSPMAVISITRTGIGATINWRISNASRLNSTERNTLISCEVQKLLRKFGLRPLGKQQNFEAWNGSVSIVVMATGVERLRENIATRVVENQKDRLFDQQNVIVAVRHLQRINRAGNIVHRNVRNSKNNLAANNEMLNIENKIHCPWSENHVNYVEHLSKLSQNIDQRNFAHRHAGNPQSVPVYDLTVEGQPEFFANGVLVHNTRDAGAYTVGLLMGRFRYDGAPSDGSEDRWWILDVIREQMDAGQREKLIVNTANKDGYKVIVAIEQEPGSGGKESAQATVRRLAGFKTRKEPATGSKEDRADNWASLVNAESFTVRKAPWTASLIEEMRYFPFGTYKDQVDAGSLAYAVCCKRAKKIGAFN